MGIQHEAKMSCFAVLRLLGLQGLGPNIEDWEMQGEWYDMCLQLFLQSKA